MYKNEGRNSDLSGFCDADYAGDPDTRRSTTGYAFCYANNLDTLASQRQKLVTLSTTEAEYVAATAAAGEAIWFRNLLKDVDINSYKPIVIHIDNQSAIRLAKNPEYHKRTQHIEVRYHFRREKVASQEIIVEYISTENQRADTFTKAVPRDRLNKLCNMLGLVSLSKYSKGECVE